MGQFLLTGFTCMWPLCCKNILWGVQGKGITLIGCSDLANQSRRREKELWKACVPGTIYLPDVQGAWQMRREQTQRAVFVEVGCLTTCWCVPTLSYVMTWSCHMNIWLRTEIWKWIPSLISDRFFFSFQVSFENVLFIPTGGGCS